MAEGVAARLKEAGRTVDIRFTTAHGDAESIAGQACNDAPPPHCVVACGGDGTIQQAAHALASLKQSMKKECPAFGLAPTGRCNDFARALGIRSDADAIAAVLLNGSPRPIDLGLVNGRYFCTVATVGIDAEVTSFVDTMKMPLRGTPAYVYGALRVLARYRPHHLRIEGDFGVIDRPLFLASSANTPFYGGNIRIAPDARPTDGLLDLCVIDPVSRLRAVRLIPQLLAGRHGSLPIVQFHRARRLTIDSRTPCEIWADGERIAATPVTIEVVPGAVRIPTPA